MASSVTKTEFLKRYLEKDKKCKRIKKPKTTNSLVHRVKIVNKDIDLKSINFDQKEVLEEAEDEPIVAEVIDERPEDIQIKELYDSSRWKRLDSSPVGNVVIALENPEASSSSNRRHDSDSDTSLHSKTKPARKRLDSDNDCSPQTVKRHDSGSDCSPPRNRQAVEKVKGRHDSEDDLSPPRKSNAAKGHSRTEKSSKILANSIRKKEGSDSDLSPERIRRETPRNNSRNRLIRQGSDSDLSPPREGTGDMKRPVKTLSGLKAGLQNAVTLREETQDLREREKRHIKKLDAELSGRHADTIVRDRKTGKRRDFEEENREKAEKEKRSSEQQQKYAQWGKGVEQAENSKKKFEEDFYEMSKPLARYKDDEDLEEQLKSLIHADDPMAEYINKKRKKDNVSQMPVYQGPPPPPNRFGIKPGYRWDGVDRSNGFEKKIFDKSNATKAVQEEAYLWSVQNM